MQGVNMMNSKIAAKSMQILGTLKFPHTQRRNKCGWKPIYIALNRKRRQKAESKTRWALRHYQGYQVAAPDSLNEPLGTYHISALNPCHEVEWQKPIQKKWQWGRPHKSKSKQNPSCPCSGQIQNTRGTVTNQNLGPCLGYCPILEPYDSTTNRKCNLDSQSRSVRHTITINNIIVDLFIKK